MFAAATTAAARLADWLPADEEADDEVDVMPPEKPAADEDSEWVFVVAVVWPLERLRSGEVDWLLAESLLVKLVLVTIDEFVFAVAVPL